MSTPAKHALPFLRPALLAAGAALTIATHLRWGLGDLAWVSPLPWLLFARGSRGWKDWLWLSTTVYGAWALATCKIVTAPMPMVMALGFALPFSTTALLPLLVREGLRRRLGEGWSNLGFATAVASAELIQANYTPFGTWSAWGHTQTEHLGLLQLISVTGLVGIGFLVALVASILETRLARPRSAPAMHLVLAFGLVLVVSVLGDLRLRLDEGHRNVVPVAAIPTTSKIGLHPKLPTLEQRQKVQDELFARSREAADNGAQLLVWTEGATMLWPHEKPLFEDRLKAFAQHYAVDLVASYIVVLDAERLNYDNQYTYVRRDGTIDHTYLKHEPVPGEPATRGHGPAGVVELGDSRVSGAICYDYDFPYLARRHADQNVDLVALPSSDWRGIDPIHTEMAKLRAIESGHSIVRSTRFGLSAAIDHHGRLLARHSAFNRDHNGRVPTLHAALPGDRVSTVYSQIGDLFGYLCLTALLLLGTAALRPRLIGLCWAHVAGHRARRRQPSST